MPLSTEQLMRKRYKVISKYPGSEDWEEIGAIITLPDPRYKYSGDIVCGEELFNIYPNIYEPLAWYAEREKEDMPKYIKAVRGISTPQNSVYKVIYWDDFAVQYMIVCIKNVYGAMDTYSVKDFLPSDETEYLSYIKQLQK